MRLFHSKNEKNLNDEIKKILKTKFLFDKLKYKNTFF